MVNLPDELEEIATGIKQHKLTAAAVALLLIGVAVGEGFLPTPAQQGNRD